MAIAEPTTAPPGAAAGTRLSKYRYDSLKCFSNEGANVNLNWPKRAVCQRAIDSVRERVNGNNS